MVIKTQIPGTNVGWTPWEYHHLHLRIYLLYGISASMSFKTASPENIQKSLTDEEFLKALTRGYMNTSPRIHEKVTSWRHLSRQMSMQELWLSSPYICLICPADKMLPDMQKFTLRLKLWKKFFSLTSLTSVKTVLAFSLYYLCSGRR